MHFPTNVVEACDGMYAQTYSNISLVWYNLNKCRRYEFVFDPEKTQFSYLLIYGIHLFHATKLPDESQSEYLLLIKATI